MALSDHPMWRKPQHHLDSEHNSDHVHWIELFYDLIHVVVIFMLGNYLSHHASVDGFLVFTGIFIAIWFGWADSSVFNSLFISTDMYHRMIMSVQITTIMFMAAAIPHMPEHGWVMFSLAYAANRAFTALLYYRAIRHKAEATGFAAEMCRNFSILAILFAVSAFLPAPYNYWLFAAGIACIQLLYMTPKIGVLRFERSVPRLGHMSERFALLLLIVLGEGFFKLCVTLADKLQHGVYPGVYFNFFLGGVSIFVLCWIYFDFVGNGKPKNNTKRVLVTWWLSHLFLMLAGIMIGVALTGEVKVGFMDSYPIKYAWMGCIGLAVYLLCLQLIQNCIETRVAHRFSGYKTRLFGIVLALITLALVSHIPAILGNLLWCTALFTQALAPLRRAYRTLSVEK